MSFEATPLTFFAREMGTSMKPMMKKMAAGCEEPRRDRGGRGVRSALTSPRRHTATPPRNVRSIRR